MNPTRVLVGGLVRSLVLVAVMAAYGALLSVSESTDGLGAGLLAFLILVALAFTWALVDAARSGFLVAFLTWLLTSAVAGIGIPVVLILIGTSDNPVEVADLFFAMLILVFAVIGLALGTLVHKFRRDVATENPQPAETSHL